MKTMNTLAERLNHAMSLTGMTQGQLARAVNMAQPTIWRLTSGQAKGTSRIIDIADALGVRPEWLANGDEPMRAQAVAPYDSRSNIPPESQWGTIDVWDSHTPLRDDEVEVPFLKDIEFACGTGRIMNEDHNGFKLRFSKSTLRRVGANSDGSGVLCFPAKGDSMEPFIPDGTTVAVNTNDKRIIDGKIYAISQNGWNRIKLLYQVGPNTVSIRSYNNAEHPVEEKSLSEVDIIGRVFWWAVLDY